MSQKPRKRLRRRRRKPNYVLRTLLFLILLVITAYFFLQSATFNINSIVVTGNKEVPADEIIRLSGLQKGVNIFSVNTEPSIVAITTNPLISEAAIQNKYPSSIEIKVSEREAVALIPSQNGMMYVDKDGYCIKEKRQLANIELPIITGSIVPAQFPLGKKFTSADLALGLEVVKQLDQELCKRISEVNVKNNYISLFLIDGSQIRIGESQRLQEKISLFDAILEEENKKPKARGIEYIDVSYEGAPVIKYKENW